MIPIASASGNWENKSKSVLQVAERPTTGLSRDAMRKHLRKALRIAIAGICVVAIVFIVWIAGAKYERHRMADSPFDVYGEVIDDNGPVADVEVRLAGQTDAVKTDANGRYRFH